MCSSLSVVLLLLALTISNGIRSVRKTARGRHIDTSDEFSQQAKVNSTFWPFDDGIKVNNPGSESNPSAIRRFGSFDDLDCPAASDPGAPQASSSEPGSKYPYMVYSAAGDHNNVMNWLSCGSPNFNLYVSFYGEDATVEQELRDAVQSHDGLFESGVHGFKDNLFYVGWGIANDVSHPDYSRYYHHFEGVKYIAMIDDDLTFTANKFNLYFDIISHLNLCFASASLVPGEKTGRGSNGHVEKSLVRLGAYVETNMKTFRRDCLEPVMDAYIPVLLGYGSESFAASVLHKGGFLTDANYGVVDAIVVQNPTVRPNGKREQLLVGVGDVEWYSFTEHHPDLVDMSWLEQMQPGWLTPGHCVLKYPLAAWASDQQHNEQ